MRRNYPLTLALAAFLTSPSGDMILQIGNATCEVLAATPQRKRSASGTRARKEVCGPPLRAAPFRDVARVYPLTVPTSPQNVSRTRLLRGVMPRLFRSMWPTGSYVM